MAELVPLSIDGSWLIKSPVHVDDRGFFREWHKGQDFTKYLAREFSAEQANLSKSKKGVIRGIHYSVSIQGQAKVITCVKGRIWDVIVDLRTNSPTFKKWIAVELVDSAGDSLFISEGLGHAFQALEEDSVVSYLLSSSYNPQTERGINPFDSELGITWPISSCTLSDKDMNSPGIESLYKR